MKIDVKTFLTALQQIGRMTAPEFVHIDAKPGELTIMGENGSTAMIVKLEVKHEETWQLAVQKTVFDQTLKGRATINMTATEQGRLSLASNKFRAEFSTQPFNDAPAMELENATSFSKNQRAFLDTAIEHGSLSPVYEGDTLFCLAMSPDKCRAACFDQLQFAYLESEGVKGEIEFALPTKTFNTVLAAAKSSGSSTFGVAISPAALFAKGDDWKLQLPFMQSDVQQTIEDVANLVNGFGKSIFRCETTAFAAAIRQATVALETGGFVEVEAAGNELTVSGSSAIGNVKEILECNLLTKKPHKLCIDPNVVARILDLVPSEYIEFGAHNNVFFFIRSESDTVLATYGGMLAETA